MNNFEIKTKIYKEMVMWPLTDIREPWTSFIIIIHFYTFLIDLKSKSLLQFYDQKVMTTYVFT